MTLKVGELAVLLRLDDRPFKQGMAGVKGEAAKTSQSLDHLGKAALAIGAGLAVGVGATVKMAMDFEKAMSGVASVANASAEEMKDLGDAAKAAGADVDLAGVTATSAAQAQMELVKAGVSVSDVLGGALKGSLSLAVAGQLDMADAATIAAQSMNLFQLEGEDVGHVADVMAAAANKSAADVSQLGQALRQGGLLAAQTGLSLESTVGTLAAFADRALIGSDAGTSLKTMLQRLTPQSAEAKKQMMALGFSAFDASGEFIGMEGLAQQLQDSLGGLSTAQRNAAMNVMFGSDAIRGANVLMELGAEGMRDYTTAVDDQGAATRMAAMQTDNLAGDIEALGGAVESVMIDLGENAQGPLRALTQNATAVVNAIGQMPEGAQNATIAVGGLAAAAGLAGGGFLLAAPRIVATKDALENLAASLPRTVGGLRRMGSFLTGPWGLALGAAVAGLMFYAKKKADATARTEEFVTTLDEESGALTRETRALVVNNLQKSGAYDLARKMGIALKDVTAAALGEADAQERVNAARIAYQQAGAGEGTQAQRIQQAADLAKVMNEQSAAVQGAADVWALQREAVGVTSGEVAGMTGALERMAPAQDKLTRSTEEGAGATDDYAGQVADLGGEMEDTRSAAEKLEEAVEGLTQATINADRAAIDYEAGLDDLRKTLKSNGDTLDIDTKKGRENLSAVIDLTESIHEHVQARADEGASVDQLQGVYKRHRRDLRETLEQAGFTRKEVRELIEQYGLTPKQVNTTLNALGVEEAVGGIDRVKGAVGRLGETVREINGEMRVKVDGGWSMGIERNTGGPIPGARTHADTVAAWLTPGEYVHNEAAVDHYGLGFMEAINRRQLPRFAAGGPVGNITAAMSAALTGVTKMPAMGDIVGLGRWLQAQGFRVDGHPAFGGNWLTGHSPTGYHPKARAIDANIGPGGASAYERAMIAKYLPVVVGMAGGRIVENLHPFNDPVGHDDHWHLAMARGAYIDRPFAGRVKMAENEPEFVTPDSKLRTLIREETVRAGGGQRPLEVTQIFNEKINPLHAAAEISWTARHH